MNCPLVVTTDVAIITPFPDAERCVHLEFNKIRAKQGGGNVDWLYNILGGIVSGLIASVVFLVVTRWIRPKIFISKHISAYPSDTGEEVLRIKIINLRHRAVADLTVQIFLERKRAVHNGEIKVRTPVGKKFTSHTQQQRKFRDKVYDNARRIRIDYNDLLAALATHPDGYLVVEVFARDAISGVGAAFTREYALSTDMCMFGSFEVGNGATIVPYSGTETFQLPTKVKAARERLKAHQAAATPQPVLQAQKPQGRSNPRPVRKRPI